MDLLAWAILLLFIMPPIWYAWSENNKRLKQEIVDLQNEIRAKDRIIERLQNPKP
ncbi:hypothetical protein [Billgrantia ethanolica]|uniref:Phage shock protein B n=1 Tax=Billgrantia ethanolica TaxID=2733486 RepID=A0ABS9A8W5_9GAMM|nr:hypothetical protein [Halomonas ethanolica]MCE8005281.1 hypothetical protein [Halomonas ethanolica]